MSEFNTRPDAGDESTGEDAPVAMPAEFGLAMATFVVVASMVGTGVLTTSGYTVANVGSNQWMLFLWIIGGITAVCGALTLAELSAALPRTGGDYVYLFEAYGPLPAFLSGWVSFVIGFAGPSAASAFGSAKYLLRPLEDPRSGTLLAELSWPGLGDPVVRFEAMGPGVVLVERILATALILGFGVVHVRGRRQTAQVQGWITALKLGLLGAFTLAGLAAGRSHGANLLDRTPVDSGLAMGMLFSLVYIYYAYTGWNAASYMAGEVKDAQHRLPRAILLGTGGVLVLYLGLNVVYALALSASDIRQIIADPANTQGMDAVAPIAELAAERLFGSGWSAPWSVAVGLMLLSSLSAYLLIGPRVLFAMAEAGQFPAIAARLTPRARTPAIATVFQVAAALLLLWIGSVESIILYAGIGLSLFSMLAMSSIYILRRRRPDLPRPFRTPGYPVTPALYLILTALMTGAAFSQRPRVSLYALASILAGVPIYYLWRLGSRPKPVEERDGD